MLSSRTARFSPKLAEFTIFFEKILSWHFNFTGSSGYHYDRKEKKHLSSSGEDQVAPPPSAWSSLFLSSMPL